MAAVSCLRSLAGFGFPLFAPTMYQSLGYGKGNTILAAVAIALGCPAYVDSFLVVFEGLQCGISPWVFWKYGQRIRESSKYARKSAAEGQGQK